MRRQTLKVCYILLVQYINPLRVGHSQRSGFSGIAAAADAKANASGEDKEDYKGESKFASHLKAGTAASSFAKSRTLKEQREYLPAFACREDLLRVIRDNQGTALRY